MLEPTKKLETWYTPEHNFWSAVLIDEQSEVNPVGMAIGFATEEEAEKQAIMIYRQSQLAQDNEAVQE